MQGKKRVNLRLEEDNMPTITLDHVSKYYRVERHWLWKKSAPDEIGVEDVNLTIEQGEFISVIGSSGAGKSTLLNLISGELKPSRGTVSIDGIPVTDIRRRKGKQMSTLIGYVPQHQNLNRSITIQENLNEAAKAGGKRYKDKKDFSERTKKVLGLVGMSGVEDKYPGELMAGQFRRVELACAIINSPPILVLDEVIANVDPDSMWDVFLLLNEINRRGTTIIMATHNSEFVNMLRKRVVMLVHGRVYSDNDKGRFGQVSKKK